MIRIKHNYQSPKADVPTAGIVKPTHWNEDHKIEDVSGGIVLGRKVGSAGELEELPVRMTVVNFLLDAFTGIMRIPRGTSAERPPVPDLLPGDTRFNTTFNRGEMWDGTTWQTLALGDNQFTGALSWSIVNVEPTGWIFFFGSVGRAGSGASHARDDSRNLFNVLWALDATIFPLVGGGARGASATADWDSFKAIQLPDWRERGFAISGNMMGSTPNDVLGNGAGGGFEIPATLYKTGGQKSHVLVASELAKHTHVLPDPIDRSLRGNLGGVGVGTQIWYDGNVDPPGPPPVLRQPAEVGDDLPHNVTQPTVMLNCFIKL